MLYPRAQYSEPDLLTLDNCLCSNMIYILILHPPTVRSK